ncbi:ankyrin repeat and SAM domain containing 6 protein [Rutstroemia sp. NJR-2017a BVV2]|nr:ankyrin repeat and SAM domain containing 6 protein [Rutstroemia sp. NJR-2017a BVV2]
MNSECLSSIWLKDSLGNGAYRVPSTNFNSHNYMRYLSIYLSSDFKALKMTNFEYKPISLKGPAFRLLRVLKGLDDDPIQCQLFESKIPSSEDYAALSYTWGSTSRPCDLIINGNKMTVTKNVYLALRDIRCREKDQVLWVDALSINQSDKNEQGQHVQQMGSIYSKAERVIIWLGEATYDTDYVMYYMKRLEEESVKYAPNDQHRQEIPYKQWVDIWSAVIRDLRPDQRGLLVEGLQLLLNRNWFKRVWVIQETGNARAADIVCGSKSVSASIFALIPSLLEVTPDLHCQSIIDIMPGSLRDSSWWSKKRDLYTMLGKFRNSEATDPRDKIYALLGISLDTYDTDLLKADYGKDLQDVVFKTVSFLLNFHKFNTRRFFDWTLPEFLGKLDKLPVEVLKCAMDTGHKWALQEGHEAIVKLLLEKGAELETKSTSGQTPLSWAAGNGNEAIVKLLLEKGAELEAKDSFYSRTPLLWATGYGHEVVVKLLLEKGAEIETKSTSGRTPLLVAAEYGREAVVKLLLEKGAKLETKDLYGRTPLSLAAGFGHEVVVKLLLEKGAEIETKNTSGRTPLSLAADMGTKQS